MWVLLCASEEAPWGGIAEARWFGGGNGIGSCSPSAVFHCHSTIVSIVEHVPSGRCPCLNAEKLPCTDSLLGISDV